MSDEKIKIIATNRKARHEYIIEDTLEAGLVLLGTEIKSIRAGRANIQEAYIAYRDGEMWVLGMHISAYDMANRMNHDPLRPRKLLLHRREIARWVARSQQRGYTMIPLQLYLRRGRAKLEIALAKGKKIYDKRESIAERETKRRIEREMSERTRRRG